MAATRSTIPRRASHARNPNDLSFQVQRNRLLQNNQQLLKQSQLQSVSKSIKFSSLQKGKKNGKNHKNRIINSNWSMGKVNPINYIQIIDSI